MGHYQMKRMPTRANHKDPRYIEAFDWLRDLEFTVKEARYLASDVVKLMDKHPALTIEQALKGVFE